VYADKAQATRTKGFNEKYGFHINRPFYFVQRYPMKRVVQCHGAHHLRLNKLAVNRNNIAQQFFFDEVSKTI
jgi:hypothetical protein